jgi:hypothetical protein
LNQLLLPQFLLASIRVEESLRCWIGHSQRLYFLEEFLAGFFTAFSVAFRSGSRPSLGYFRINAPGESLGGFSCP